ncbi:MAG: orotate phosphoribosyltransferase, partial [Burkholderiales bacterium]
AEPCGVIIALDRQEKAICDGQEMPWSALQLVRQQWGLEVVSIATLTDLLDYLSAHKTCNFIEYFYAVTAYRERYGV